MLKNIVKPVVNGFKLLASEGKWVFIKGFRSWEIRQMEKRLAEEYQNLGKSYAESQTKGAAFDPKATDLNFFFSHSPDTVMEGGLVDA